MGTHQSTAGVKGPAGRGKLYVVATPIGNLADITMRAVETLKSVNLIAAEDTRLTRRLLSHYGITTPMTSYHEHNEIKRSAELVARIEAGESIALVSDAGTPTLSDPGYRLVKEAVDRNIDVVPVPGVSAAIAALSASGMPTDSFVFLGFMPRRKGKRSRELQRLADQGRTMIFYESPRRILDLLRDMREILGDRNGVLCRELTKRYEEFVYGCLSDIIASLESRDELKGECTLVVAAGAEGVEAFPSALKEEITAALKDKRTKLSDMACELAERYRISRKKVYQEALRVKKSRNDSE